MTQAVKRTVKICDRAIYHTEMLGYKGKITLGVMGLIGITTLIVGILAYLQVGPGLGACNSIS